MNKKILNIWGREFSLNVCLECYEGETVTDLQKKALEELLDSEEVINEAKTDVEKYIVSNYKKKFPEGKVDNIFKYVIPRDIYVPHSRHRQCAAIICNYKFDMEHGLAIVFENGKLREITTEDSVI